MGHLGPSSGRERSGHQQVPASLLLTHADERRKKRRRKKWELSGVKASHTEGLKEVAGSLPAGKGEGEGSGSSRKRELRVTADDGVGVGVNAGNTISVV